MKTIYVGNLPYTITHRGLERMFSAFGTVRHARVIKDLATSQSRGFGFVEMEDAAAAAAVAALNGADRDGRRLFVSEACPHHTLG